MSENNAVNFQRIIVREYLREKLDFYQNKFPRHDEEAFTEFICYYDNHSSGHSLSEKGHFKE